VLRRSGPASVAVLVPARARPLVVATKVKNHAQVSRFAVLSQMPIYRRLPKRGFNVLNPKELAVVNIGRLQKLIDSGRLDASKPVDGAALEAAGMVRQRRDGIRLLASGELKAKLAITVDHASASAISAVEKAGGTVTIVAPKVSPEDADANKLKAEKRADKKAGKKSSKSGKGNE
jgi:large subunit ribosomal protein L15